MLTSSPSFLFFDLPNHLHILRSIIIASSSGFSVSVHVCMWVCVSLMLYVISSRGSIMMELIMYIVASYFKISIDRLCNIKSGVILVSFIQALLDSNDLIQ